MTNDLFNKIYHHVKEHGKLISKEGKLDNWHADIWELNGILVQLMDGGYTRRLFVKDVLDIRQTYTFPPEIVKGNIEELIKIKNTIDIKV